MDKTAYQTYEYLPASNDAEPDQLFVVQDDGTFLVNRQIQYVAQVEDVKETLDGAEACTVYDVTPHQQYFVDVTENPTELISVSDMVPVPEESNTFYGNSFLLQSIPSESTDQDDKDLAMELKDSTQQEVAIVNGINKQDSTCTEITMSDEQYKSLEEKGWVLLETNDKIYILDSYGLHDITTNHDLIQSLRNESKSGNVETEARTIKTDSEVGKLKFESIIVQNAQGEPVNQISIVPETVDDQNKVEIDAEPNTLSAKEEESSATEENDFAVKDVLLSKAEIEKAVHGGAVIVKQKENCIRIKTRQCFKRIPDKIILGKTINGKRLIAKVSKCTRTFTHSIKEDKNETKAVEKNIFFNHPRSVLLSNNKTLETSVNDIDGSGGDKQFEKLLQQILQEDPNRIPQQVSVVSGVMSKLMGIPAFHSSVVGRNIMVTKVVESNLATYSVSPIVFVTGTVTAVETGSCFVHVPDLLQKLTAECLASNTKEKLLHVHIFETKRKNGVGAISVKLNERELPFQFSSNETTPVSSHESVPFLRDTVPPRQISRMYACGSCASIFLSENELAEHQETHQMDAEGTLTIDTDKLPNSSTSLNLKGYRYLAEKSSNGNDFSCLECGMKFSKLNNCLRHIKAHFSKLTVKEPPYKCKMCKCSYYYASSLAKHISKDHLQNKVNSLYCISNDGNSI